MWVCRTTDLIVDGSRAQKDLFKDLIIAGITLVTVQKEGGILNNSVDRNGDGTEDTADASTGAKLILVA